MAASTYCSAMSLIQRQSMRAGGGCCRALQKVQTLIVLIPLTQAFVSSPHTFSWRGSCFHPLAKGWVLSVESVVPRNSIPRSEKTQTEGALWRESLVAGYRSYRESAHLEDRDSPPLLDLRDETEFREQHLIGSTSIPIAELASRMFELPPPYEDPVRIFGSAEQVAEAEQLLTERGWKVQDKIISNTDPTAWTSGTEEGEASRPVWRPTAFLEEVLNMDDVQGWLAEKSEGEAIDVGCGAGRDLVLMAQRLGSSWRVTGLDNDKGALHRAAALSRREGVEVNLVDTNLRKSGMEGCEADLVHGCRFLDRPLLAAIRDQHLRPGGLFVWSTFMQGSERVRPGRSLERGELGRMFAEQGGFEVLVDKEGELYTGGSMVPASFFAAWRRR